MKTYHKIQTIYKRDPKNKNKTLLEGEFSMPEFEFLKDNKWIFTEKVDGTNIRVMYNGFELKYGGKTDAAQIPATLVNVLRELFDNKREEFARMFSVDIEKEGLPRVCLYGEGYGPKIQKGGGKYGDQQDFVLFDVKVGDWWLKRDDVVDVATQLGVRVVPIIGEGPLFLMVEICREGFKSQWGDFQAEGIVARPEVELFSRNGGRIITKLKCKDFAR